MRELWYKIKRICLKLRLQPIRVYCMHHVCDKFDAESMNKGDWMQIDEFKNEIQRMQREGVRFISLTEAYHHICSDNIRNHKYAVLTFDDGYASLKEILPWLEERNIPATLFINAKYLDGVSYRVNPNEKYLTHDELFAMTSHLIEVGLHGWEHLDASQQTMEEFRENVVRCLDALRIHPRYVPFMAYAWSRNRRAEDAALGELGLVPLFVRGGGNYDDSTYIDRNLLRI